MLLSSLHSPSPSQVLYLRVSLSRVRWTSLIFFKIISWISTASLNPSKANDALKTQYDIPQRKKDKKKINSAQTAGTDSESARNDAKRARTNKWANAKKTTYTKKPKASKAPHQGIQANKAADRNKVKAELRAAADRMKNTVNLPGPKDQFQLGTSKRCFLLTLCYDTYSFRNVFWEGG